MSNNPGLAHSVPPLQTGAKFCSRCGKDFHLFRQKKNCHNCGCLVCENCSSYRTKLPQFGYNQEVRCCTYCAHFLKVSRMDFARLSELNIKTLRGYLLSYNVSTQGMLEKQDLIKAIQSYKPIPEASEVYFRQHLPAPAEKAPSLFGELGGLGRSESPTESTESSSSNSSSGDSWWDIDKFFSKLFSPDEQSSTARAQTGPNRSQPQSQQPQQPQYRPEPQTQYRPQPQAARASTNTTFNYNSSNTSSYSFRPPPENPPSTANTFRPPSGNPPPNPYYSTGQSPTANTFSPRPSPRPQAQTAQTPRTTTSTPRSQPQTSQPSQNSQQNTLTLDQLVTSDTDPSTLSIKVIKSILDHSCVSYVGVVEKKDLVDRLQKLIDNTKAEREMIREQEENAKSKSPAQSAKGSTSGVSEDDNLCKICCDAALNCVMLNCNHMSTCMDCGKLIMEGSRMCPICREYVVKLLHVFRA